MGRRCRLAAALLALAATAGGAGCASLQPPPQPTAVVESWHPEPAVRWQWQLAGAPDLGVDADVFELDAFNTAAGDVDVVHADGRRAICYLVLGAYEGSRPDAERFPPQLLGRSTSRPAERWLDIRQWPALAPVISDRLRLCVRKGFDAVGVDRVDGYAHRTGFPLSYDDQLVFNRRVAALAHSLGLAVGLHNDVHQAVALEPDFDFAVTEECVRYAACGPLAAFTAADKPVLHVEYALPTTQFCPMTRVLGFASIRKHRELDAWRDPC